MINRVLVKNIVARNKQGIPLLFVDMPNIKVWRFEDNTFHFKLNTNTENIKNILNKNEFMKFYEKLYDEMGL